MPRTDFIADFITQIRNASRAQKDKVTIPTSNITLEIAQLLKEEGFVGEVKEFSEGPKRFVRIHLKYIDGKKPSIQGIKRVSTPGRRKYVGYEDVPRVQGGLGVAIVSTSQGVMSDRKARQTKVGGELICTVW